MVIQAGNTFQYSPIVALLGGIVDDPADRRFAEFLGQALQADTQFRFCVSGFKGHLPSKKHPSFRPSFAFQTISHAAKHMDDVELGQRILTRYLQFDPTNETQYSIGHGQRAKGRNTISRGLSIISEADAVCLVGGGRGIEQYFEFARAMDKPVLPIPFLGGVSRDLWDTHGGALAKEFDEELQTLLQWDVDNLGDLNEAQIKALADRTVAAIRACVRLRCLVVMPFSTQFDWVFNTIIHPACEVVGADAVRLDIEGHSGDIVSNFEIELGRADCVIAVSAEQSGNVLYEVGYAHAAGVPVLHITQQPDRFGAETETCIYLRNHRSVWYLPRENAHGVAVSIQELSKLLQGVRKSAELF